MSQEQPAIGSSRPVHDALSKVTGTARYTDDLSLPGMLHGKLLFSDKAHARVVSVDTTRAESMDGVMGIFTRFNTPGRKYNSAKRFDHQEIPEDEQIFPEVVRHVGDRIALVVARHPEQAQRALRAIQVEYQELPAVFDTEEALAEGAPLLHGYRDGQGNRLAEIPVVGGDPEAAFGECDLILEDESTTPAVNHLALEPHSVLAEYKPGEGATVYTTTQTTFAVRLLLSEIFQLPRHQVRVVKPILGGAFGGKIPMILEPAALHAAMVCGRPVKISLSRKDLFASTRTRHATKIRVKTGVMADGTIRALDIRMVLNAGAYCTQSINVAAAAVHDVVKCYRIPHVRALALPVYTNAPVAGAMRGYGSPQIYFALESHLDRVARKLGMDRLEFRLRNLVRPEDCDPVYHEALGNPRPVDCALRGAELFGWEGKVLNLGSRRRKDPDKLYGFGMAMGTHANGVFSVHLDYTGIRIRINEDGTVIFFTGSHDMGNGSVTVQKMIISQELLVPMEMIRAVESDTTLCPYNLGDYASRGVFVSAEAVRRTAVKMRERILSEAAGLTGRTAGELVLTAHAVVDRDSGDPVMDRREFYLHIHQKEQRELEVSGSYANSAGRTSYGAHFAEVEINRKSGAVRILDYAAVHDVGKVLNRQGIEGQLEGGIHMSAGYALTEELLLDNSGKVRNGNLKQYRQLTALQMPRKLKVDFIEEGEEPGPYGAKSIGECATVPGGAALANAVAHALGTEISEIPLTPDRILQLLESAAGKGVHHHG